MARAASLIRIGRISGTHGLKGTVKFHADDPDSSALDSVSRVWLELSSLTHEYRLRSVKHVARRRFLLSLEGIDSIDTAEALAGATVLIESSDLPALKPGEFYYFQVVGIEVRLTGGQILGKIAEVFPTGSNDVWVVRNNGQEVLIPVVADVVKEIDIAGRRAIVEPIPGLLD